MSVRTIVIALLGAAALAVTAACSAPATADAASGSGLAANGQAAASGNALQAAALTTDTNGTAQPGTNQRTVTATGVGIVTGTPDILTVQLGVQTQAKAAGDALTDNNKKAADLIETLTAQGVDEKDIATSDLSIYPSYNSNGTTITGYQVTNTVTATLRAVDKAGAVIDAAARAAGDAIRLNQVAFSFADDSELRAQARASAVQQALAQAKQMADAASVSLGPVLGISENAVINSPQPMWAMADAAGAAESMPVQSGQQQLAVSVQVIVAIG